MAISADQQATLQLLLERGQTYADLAGLLGQDEPEVRARARAALTELGGADPDANVGLTDYLLGQADPIGRADASRHLREDPADHELATRLVEVLREMYPSADLPRLPGEPRTSRRRRAAPTDESGRRSPLDGLTQSQTRVMVGVASAAVILLAIVLGVAGAFGGGGESSTTASTTTASTDQQVQRVPLKPVGGGDARGEAIFGLAADDQPFIDVSLEGLDPAPSDETYVIWLMLTEGKGYPLSPISVQQDGSFQERFPIPGEVLPVVARVRYVDVSIAPVGTVRKLVRQAIEQTQLVISEPGDVVVRGRIPAGAGGGSQ